MLTILVPMAGLGSRFAKAGYALPKPLIPVHGVPMIRLVIENVRPSRPHRYVFICQRAHMHEFALGEHLKAWEPTAELVELDGLTEGAACTALTARHLVAPEDALMIVNSDQYVDIAIDSYLDDMDRRELDGTIMTMYADDPKWSYAAVDDSGHVVRVVEKQVISPHATVGIYNFRRAEDFFRGAESMIAKELRVNGEFYVAPVYNELVGNGARIGVHDIGEEGRGMYGLGIPADLDSFLALPLSRQATEELL